MTVDRWVAIDFETATREPTSACALGVAVVEDLEVVDTFSWVVRPPFNEYDFWNTSVHGMCAKDTEFAPEFDEVWWEIQPLLASGRLIAHNAGFDVRVLRSLIETRELPALSYEYACTVTMARKALPHLGKHSLDILCDHYGIRLIHHDAASDAEGCARVAIACARTAGAATVSEAVESLGVKLKQL